MPLIKIGFWNAWIFMSVFLLQIPVMAFAGKSIWEKIHVPYKFRQNMLQKNIGVIANVIWLSAMGYSVFLPFRLGTPWFFTGLSVFIIGLIIMVIATFDFISTPADQLITRGTYKYSRNPMYLATLFICLGSGIAGASWLFILLSILIILCFDKEILIEERYCLDQYGSAFQEYLNRVPRWIGFRRRFTQRKFSSIRTIQ